MCELEPSQAQRDDENADLARWEHRKRKKTKMCHTLTPSAAAARPQCVYRIRSAARSIVPQISCRSSSTWTRAGFNYLRELITSKKREKLLLMELLAAPATSISRSASCPSFSFETWLEHESFVSKLRPRTQLKLDELSARKKWTRLSFIIFCSAHFFTTNPK